MESVSDNQSPFSLEDILVTDCGYMAHQTMTVMRSLIMVLWVVCVPVTDNIVMLSDVMHSAYVLPTRRIMTIYTCIKLYQERILPGSHTYYIHKIMVLKFPTVLSRTDHAIFILWQLWPLFIVQYTFCSFY